MAISSKADLRKQFLTKRNEIPTAVRARDSALIRQRFLGLPAYDGATTLLCYISYSSEVETRGLLEEAFMRKKRVVVPAMDETTNSVVLSELTTLADLEPGFFKGIHEPAAAKRRLVDPSEIELAVVPGVAFDRKGGRIGMGGGHFDRMIPKMKNATRVALAYSIQVHKTPLPLEAHDMRMHLILTESEVIETGLPVAHRGAGGA